MALQTEENVSTPLPIWMSIPIILLCLAGGGWIIHWYVMTDPLSHESTILGDPVTQAQWQPQTPRQPINGRRYVRPNGGNAWELRTELARADASTADGKTTIRTITYNTASYGFVPDEVKSTIFAARSLAFDAARTTALKLTPQQIRQLRQLSATINMAITPADRQELSNAVAAYAAAKPAERAAAETKVLQTLDQVAQKSMAATKQQATDRANQINAIVTPDQWKQSAAMGGAK